MDSNAFNRAVDSSQGAPNTASTAEDELLPGFEPPAENIPERPAGDPAGERMEPASNDPFTPPPEASAPPLPGLVTPPPIIHFRQVKNMRLELHPPAKKRASLAAHNAECVKPKTAVAFNATTALAALSCVLGIGLIAACISLLRSPEPPAEKPATDIPLALLPETADPDLWETVASMSGEVDGAFLSFERGLATDADGRTYKLLLDFCRSGADIYAKVAGEKTYVVRLDGLGKITKAYPAPKNNKPLKDIFGK